MHYFEKGSGFPLLLLHGYCETGTVWNSIIDELASQVRLIIPDLPGFGLSEPISDDFSLEDVAQMSHELMQSLGFTEYIVMGHSLGGYVALAIEKLYSSHIRAFGLIHSTAFADSKEKKEGRDQVIKIVSNKGPGLFLQNFYQNLFYQPIKEVVEDLQREGKNIKGDSIISYAQAMKNRPDSTDLMRSDKPKLFIAGVKDGAVSISDSRSIRDLSKNCSYLELENTGHMGMFEEPKLLIKQITDFLNPLV